MKAIKFFAMTAMAAAMITSCSNEDELSQSNYPSDIEGTKRSVYLRESPKMVEEPRIEIVR